MIGALALEEFGKDAGVLPHERTMPGPIEDRLALLRALEMNVSPIYGIFRGGGDLGDFYDSLENRPTQARFQDEHGILHRLWVIDAPAEIEMLTSAVGAGPLVIADGHHRYETALAYHRERAGEPGGHDAIMCFCVDADGEDLVVLPYNRALKVAGTGAGLKSLSRRPARRPIGAEPDKALSGSSSDHPFVFVLPRGQLPRRDHRRRGRRCGRRARQGMEGSRRRRLARGAAARSSRPTALTELTFTKDPAEVTRLVDAGWDAGVLLRALKASQIVDVARSGERMPQKASYFWPKAITGLVFRSLSAPESLDLLGLRLGCGRLLVLLLGCRRRRIARTTRLEVLGYGLSDRDGGQPLLPDEDPAVGPVIQVRSGHDLVREPGKPLLSARLALTWSRPRLRESKRFISSNLSVRI